MFLQNILDADNIEFYNMALLPHLNKLPKINNFGLSI